MTSDNSRDHQSVWWPSLNFISRFSFHLGFNVKRHICEGHVATFAKCWTTFVNDILWVIVRSVFLKSMDEQKQDTRDTPDLWSSFFGFAYPAGDGPDTCQDIVRVFCLVIVNVRYESRVMSDIWLTHIDKKTVSNDLLTSGSSWTNSESTVLALLDRYIGIDEQGMYLQERTETHTDRVVLDWSRFWAQPVAHWCWAHLLLPERVDETEEMLDLLHQLRPDRHRKLCVHLVVLYLSAEHDPMLCVNTPYEVGGQGADWKGEKSRCWSVFVALRDFFFSLSVTGGGCEGQSGGRAPRMSSRHAKDKAPWDVVQWSVQRVLQGETWDWWSTPMSSIVSLDRSGHKQGGVALLTTPSNDGASVALLETGKFEEVELVWTEKQVLAAWVATFIFEIRQINFEVMKCVHSESIKN